MKHRRPVMNHVVLEQSKRTLIKGKKVQLVSTPDFSGVHGINNNVGCGSSRGLCCSTYIISPTPFPEIISANVSSERLTMQLTMAPL